jgi:ribosome biogenesis GTPase / thiamine phosphate phosphatase
LDTGIVYKKSTGTYHVSVNGQTIVCSISSLLRRELHYPMHMESKPKYLQHVWEVEDIHAVDPVAVGDRVVFTDADDGTGMITEVMPRTNKLTRRTPGPKPLEQVIVANVDQVIPVIAAAQPKPKWGMMDRYLASAAACEIPAVICITKLDAIKGKRGEREVIEVIEDYQRIGYRVIVTSAADGMGIEDVKSALHERVSVFIGMSGVGKTTLLNAVQPGLGLRVSEINLNIDKGRHTTTHLQMFPLDSGGGVVDTPGMKVFGFWDVEAEDVALLFAEMAQYVGQCRFGLNCRHDHEPACAIKEAVEAGDISQRRYESYLYIRDYMYAEDK